VALDKISRLLGTETPQVFIQFAGLYASERFQLIKLLFERRLLFGNFDGFAQYTHDLLTDAPAGATPKRPVYGVDGSASAELAGVSR
jgi:hypothetical protein